MPLQLFGGDGSIQMDLEDHIRVFSCKGAAALLDPRGGQALGAGESNLVPGLPPLYGSAEVQLRPPSAAPGLPPSGFAGAIDALPQAIVDGTEVPVPGEEGRKSLELVLAAYESIETGRAVSLPLPGAQKG